jgi:UDPglucose 6-dehydrogenase
MPAARAILGDRIQFAATPYAAVEGAEALFLVTEWSEFRQPDFGRVLQLMKRPVLFDGRNIWNPERLRALGFTYQGVGRGS